MPQIRPIHRHNLAEHQQVVHNMRATLIDVMGKKKGTDFYSLDWLRQRLAWHLSLEEKAQIFIIENHDQSLLGHAIVRMETEADSNQNYGYFSTLYILPAFRRQGLGQKLIQAVHQWCKEKYLPYILYNTATDNHKLRRLFKTQGYQLVLEAQEMVQLKCSQF